MTNKKKPIKVQGYEYGTMEDFKEPHNSTMTLSHLEACEDDESNCGEFPLYTIMKKKELIKHLTKSVKRKVLWKCPDCDWCEESRENCVNHIEDGCDVYEK